SPSWLSRIEEVEAGVDELPALPIPARMAAMDRIGATIESLPHNRALAHDELFRVDAASSLRVGLPGSLMQDLGAATLTYVRLFPAMYPEEIYSGRLVTRFLKTHLPDTDVPLLDLYHGFVEPEDSTSSRPAAFPEPVEGAGVMKRLLDLLAGPDRDGTDGREV